jgi:hypothetical protein
VIVLLFGLPRLFNRVSVAVGTLHVSFASPGQIPQFPSFANSVFPPILSPN